MFLVSGGGSFEEIMGTNQWFAKFINFGRVLYIPIAGDEIYRTYEECFTYVNEMFKNLGINEVILVTDLKLINRKFLNQFDAIYFSGGSETKLTLEIESADIIDELLAFEKEKIIYGQSAGAIAFGCEAGYYKNEKCLSIIDYGIICHYNPSKVNDIRKQIKRDVICVSDGNSFIYQNGKIKNIVGQSIIIKSND